MKKITSLLLVLLLAAAVSAAAAPHRANPYDDRYKYETQQLKESGAAKSIFVVFDENRNQVTQNLVLVYRDASGTVKELPSDANGRMTIVFREANYYQALKLKVSGVEFDVVGDTFEDFDYEDIRKGEVDFYALELDVKNKIARIYDAD